MQTVPRLIGLDWGTSSLRAYLIGDDGAVVARTAQPWGVMSAPSRDFAAAFATTVREWDRAYPNLPAIAAGMIGSTEGWVRAPYCPCPAGPRELAANLLRVAVDREGTLDIIPGVEYCGDAPSVMRGEETQIAGALARAPEFQGDALLLLPGTHSKWVEIRAGRIVAFDTYMTGELYALLAEHSILGRPARATRAARTQDQGPSGDGEQPKGDDAQASDAAFDRGVVSARESGNRGMTRSLFLTRSLLLRGDLSPGSSLAFLSGLLIGEELRSSLMTGYRRLAIVGDPALCARYQRAFAGFGISDVAVLGETAPAGLWRIARDAGLIPSPAPHI